MKKMIALVGIVAAFLCLSITAYADDIMKIGMNGEVKAAKAVGSGSGITFTLPDIANNFLIDAIELAVFEKQENETNYKMFGESKMLENPTSLNISFGFGDISKYKEKSKYKIAYRYHVKPIDDLSKIIIAGAESKEGWRLVGEVNPNTSTEQGFVFYKNTNPTLSVDSISFQAQTINGNKTFTYSTDEIGSSWLPSDALQNGIVVQYSAEDFDTEDTLITSYKLIDVLNNQIAVQGNLPSNKTIICNSQAEYFKLILTVTDNWGASYETAPIELILDKESPKVISEFSDMGKALRGKNLYSEFTIMDNQNEALRDGGVYYTIRRSGTILYQNISLPDNENGYYTVDITNMPDGIYEIELTMFDKAHNKATHILRQTLDNTAPAVTFLTPQQNSEATLYSTWTNQSKKILIAATDEYAGVRVGYCYLDSAWQATISLAPVPSYTFSFAVSTTKTGQLYYYFYVYDNAISINKTTNTIYEGTSGNFALVSKYVWLDKTAPSVTINADENIWYGAPKTVTANFYDYPSSSGVADNSGVKTKQYCITENDMPSGNWLVYPSNGVTFSTGGVYYLHIKAIDFAGNETVETKRIMLNNIAQITSKITPTDDSIHTIYNEVNGMYVIKNTAFSTKYQFTLKDDDIADTIKTEIRLVSQDNAEYVSQTEVESTPNGSTVRDITFNMAYTKTDGNALPDGVYTMYLSISEVKNDGSIIKTTENVKGCEVVIKRDAPPTPVITVLNGSVTIDYPNETLSNSLNRTDMKALYKREYKAVIDKQPGSNAYKVYVAPIAIDDMVVTALYTDMAGNISTASKRIYKDSVDDENSIVTEGNTVTIEESRPANTYYIGTRRDKQAGINNSILNFLN